MSIQETEPFGESFGAATPQLSEDELDSFTSTWINVRQAVAERITSTLLGDIARWAADETAGFSFPAGWIDSMPMYPLGSSADGARILFGQRSQDSTLDLPSHSPLVHRRVVLAAVFDRTDRVIPQIYVSIRGWVKE